MLGEQEVCLPNHIQTYTRPADARHLHATPSTSIVLRELPFRERMRGEAVGRPSRTAILTTEPKAR